LNVSKKTHELRIAGAAIRVSWTDGALARGLL